VNTAVNAGRKKGGEDGGMGIPWVAVHCHGVDSGVEWCVSVVGMCALDSYAFFCDMEMKRWGASRCVALPLPCAAMDARRGWPVHDIVFVLRMQMTPFPKFPTTYYLSVSLKEMHFYSATYGSFNYKIVL
jgi:hypothetical protein